MNGAPAVDASCEDPVAAMEFLRELALYLHPPRTDLVDAAAVWLGRLPAAALLVEEAALGWPAFGRLSARAFASGLFMADLNGNMGVGGEYDGPMPGCHVPVWLLCRSPERLAELIDEHRRLQPLGFRAWAQYLGTALGYPRCCVES